MHIKEKREWSVFHGGESTDYWQVQARSNSSEKRTDKIPILDLQIDLASPQNSPQLYPTVMNPHFSLI